MQTRKVVTALFCPVLLLAVLCGCSIYSPQSFWEVSKTKVDLEAKNFKVRKLGAQGNASSPYLFGIPMGGGAAAGIALYKQDIQARAVRELHQNWDGKGSCFLHNINTEWTDYGVPGILIFHQYTITADIYEFNAEYVDYATRPR
jgi:hypothetical protein